MDSYNYSSGHYSKLLFNTRRVYPFYVSVSFMVTVRTKSGVTFLWN